MPSDDNVIILGKSADAWKQDFRRTFRNGSFVIVVLLILFFLFAGRPLVLIKPNELGVVQRFGKFVRTLPPGPNFRWPWPIESVTAVDVLSARRITIGYRDAASSNGGVFGGTGNSEGKEKRHEESLMLTGDENILLVELAVQYVVKDPVEFLFNVNEPDETLRDICESTLRRVIGDYGVDAPLTGGKAAIEQEIEIEAQRVADSYGLGVLIKLANLQEVQPPTEVQPAFKSVVTAKENAQKYENEAEGYRNGEIPRAEGEAAGILSQASAYAQERVLKAEGEIKRFSALLNEYRKSPEVTETRLYLETLERVLGQVETTLLDEKLSGVLPFFDMTDRRTFMMQEQPAAVPEQLDFSAPSVGGSR